MLEYGGDINFACFEARALAKNYSVSQSFLLAYAITPVTMFSSNSIYFRYLVVMAYRPTVTVQSQIRRAQGRIKVVWGLCQKRRKGPFLYIRNCR